jgi:hypothetical protein
VGTTNAVGDTVAVLFHGSRADFDAHEPSVLLRQHDYHHRLAGWFEVGAQDTGPLAAERILAALAAQAGIVTRFVVLPGQTHTFRCWRLALADSLPSLVGWSQPHHHVRRTG